ncbi:MAG: hypothetical protein ACLPX5_01685 [Dissulfurispiraceae bacterium]
MEENLEKSEKAMDKDDAYVAVCLGNPAGLYELTGLDAARGVHA